MRQTQPMMSAFLSAAMLLPLAGCSGGARGVDPETVALGSKEAVFKVAGL